MMSYSYHRIPFIWSLSCLTISIQSINFTTLLFKAGLNIGERVRSQILHHLLQVQHLKIVEFSTLQQIKSYKSNSHTLLLLLGNTTESDSIINRTEFSLLEPESYFIQSAIYHNIPTLACDGLTLDKKRHQNISFDKTVIHYGAVLSAYVCLERLGFAWLHPLEPYYPPILLFNPPNCTKYAVGLKNYTNFCLYNETESPYWPERSFHIHTQHPLEVTEVLQGHDIPQFGPHGPYCSELWTSVARNRGSSKSSLTEELLFNGNTAISSSRDTGSHIDNNLYGTNGDNRRAHIGGDNSGSSSYNRERESRTARVPYCERWEDMLADVDLMFQWTIANRLNKIEWLLLGNYKWGDELATRQKRLQVITEIGHEYSLMVGADCPIGNVQQHAWSMVDIRLPLAQQLLQIRQRVDWIFEANFDFITTESGLSEFTHPECSLMLALLNEFADYANITWGREAGIKVHCSTGQMCHNYPHPSTGEPINFNFLTYYASPTLGVFPHTVQVYAMDDPTAGAYGNDNFSYVEDYLVMEAKRGLRSVVFYGETAYWVNVDIDVPLFLPVYGQRRLHDLRRIAGREVREGFRIDGQMNFDSGWEWGYWLSDVVTARASWNPLLSPAISQLRAKEQQNNDCRSFNQTCPSIDLNIVENAKKYNEKDDEWNAFEHALFPITQIFGSVIGPRLNRLVVKLSQKQSELLILGRFNNQSSPNIKKLTGIAYLSGNDPWIDLPRMLSLPMLQPDKVRIKDTHDIDWHRALNLLKVMEMEFATIRLEMAQLYTDGKKCYTLHGTHHNVIYSSNISVYPCGVGYIMNLAALTLLSEIDDCVSMLSLRTSQVYSLYLSRDTTASSNEINKGMYQRKSRQYIKEASEIVSRREQFYRVPWERIASWRDNPTVYRFGYLWSVHSLYYWWRDQGLAEQGSLQSELSPCYLNRMDISEIAVGWGKYTMELIRSFINTFYPWTRGYPFELINCFAPPEKEYVFPKDLYPYE